jgi:copper(I)-binding protein
VNRALRATAIGVLLLGPVTLSACSSGQVNQTALQARDKVGGTAQLGQLTLREVTLAYPPSGSYARGGEAVLNAAIVNSGGKADTLVSIKGRDFQGVRVTGTGSQVSAALGGTSAPAATTTTASSGAASTTAASPTSPTSSAAAGTAATAPLPSQPPSSDANIQIPSNTAVFLGQNAPHVSLVGFTRPLTPAQSVPVTFTFRDAGSVTMNVIVANPPSELPQPSPYNFKENTEASRPANEAGGGQVGG